MGNRKNIAAMFAAFIARVSKAFFDIHDHDTVLSSAQKVGATALRRVVYAAADYWLMALSGVFIIFMNKQMDYDLLELILLMWLFNIAVANTFVVIWQRTGEDVTLGESYRRAADVIYSGSRVAGYLTFGSIVVKASFWGSPAHFVIFFHREFTTEFRMLLALLTLTATQAAVWTPIYVLGFATITEISGYLNQLQI